MVTRIRSDIGYMGLDHCLKKYWQSISLVSIDLLIVVGRQWLQRQSNLLQQHLELF